MQITVVLSILHVKVESGQLNSTAGSVFEEHDSCFSALNRVCYKYVNPSLEVFVSYMTETAKDTSQIKVPRQISNKNAVTSK